MLLKIRSIKPNVGILDRINELGEVIEESVCAIFTNVSVEQQLDTLSIIWTVPFTPGPMPDTFVAAY